MAGFYEEFLKGAGEGFQEGFFGNPNLRDFTHASKIFRTDAYGNSPKFKWNFHVYFNINQALVAQNPGIFPSAELPGLLVKNISLPRYSMAVSEMNQYNRKRYVQTKLNYDPVSVTFHDDNNNSIRQLWFNYFSYYYNDPNQTGSISEGARISQEAAVTNLNIKNIYNSNIKNDQNWGYSGEIGNTTVGNAVGIAKAPFFQSIKIYGFNQHNFALYELVNPIIEKFDHDSYDYASSNGVMENKMTIRYETVKYAQGALNGENPSAFVSGFGMNANYDKRLSPISRPGANKNILGQGGLVEAGEGIISDLTNGNYLAAIQKAGSVARTFKNSQGILQAAKSELKAGVLAAATAAPRTLFNFPASGATNGTGSQNSNSNNYKSPYAPPVSTEPNTPAGQ